MLSSLKNIFKVVDLRNKILFTLFVTLLYRLGSHVTVPGIDFAALVGLALQVLDGGEVDPGDGDVRAQPVQEDHEQREQDLVAKIDDLEDVLQAGKHGVLRVRQTARG